MFFSVIVPFKDESRFIRRCIESLLVQEFDKREYELIFVDNGSQDDSLRIVQEYPRIILVHEDEGGVYAVRNRGLEIAHGDIIAFTDADCIVAPDWLKQIQRGFDETDAGILLGERYFPSPKTTLLQVIEDYQNASIRHIIENRLTHFYYGYTNNMAVKKELFAQLGKFKELPIPGDTEFVQRYVAGIPKAKVAYRPDMRVIHQEITNVWQPLLKTRRYAEYHIFVRECTNRREVSLPTRLRIIFGCMRRHRYKLRPVVNLLIFLFMNTCFHVLGKGMGIMKLKFSRI